jgi:hypothetical protein
MGKIAPLGTVRATVPNDVTDEETIALPTSGSEVGTVGTVFPDCTYVRAGMNKERARDDFPETGGQLSPTVPNAAQIETAAHRPAERSVPRHQYDVYRRRFPFGVGEWLGRVQAPTRLVAEQTALAQFGGDLFVSLAYGSKRRAAEPLTERLAHKRSHRSPPRRKKKP